MARALAVCHLGLGQLSQSLSYCGIAGGQQLLLACYGSGLQEECTACLWVVYRCCWVIAAGHFNDSLVDAEGAA